MEEIATKRAQASAEAEGRSSRAGDECVQAEEPGVIGGGWRAFARSLSTMRREGTGTGTGDGWFWFWYFVPSPTSSARYTSSGFPLDGRGALRNALVVWSCGRVWWQCGRHFTYFFCKEEAGASSWASSAFIFRGTSRKRKRKVGNERLDKGANLLKRPA